MKNVDDYWTKSLMFIFVLNCDFKLVCPLEWAFTFLSFNVGCSSWNRASLQPEGVPPLVSQNFSPLATSPV